MRAHLQNWRKQIAYFRRNNLKSIQNIRGIVNTIAFFCVWGYAGYFVASRAEQSEKETGVPHSVQVAKRQGQRYVTKWNLNTGEKEQIGKKLSYVNSDFD